jgi:hypothetical protein
MRVRRICVDGAVAQAADTAALMRKMEWRWTDPVRKN